MALTQAGSCESCLQLRVLVLVELGGLLFAVCRDCLPPRETSAPPETAKAPATV